MVGACPPTISTDALVLALHALFTRKPAVRAGTWSKSIVEPMMLTFKLMKLSVTSVGVWLPLSAFLPVIRARYRG